MKPIESKAGKTFSQGTGYLAYVPANLPLTPPISFDADMIRLLSEADLAC